MFPVLHTYHIIIFIFTYYIWKQAVKEFLESAKEEFEEKWKNPHKVSTIKTIY